MKKVMNFFRKLLDNNTFLLVSSLVMAFVLWFYVNGYYNPEDSDIIHDVPVTVNFEDSIPEQNGLAILESSQETVDITVSGPRVYLATLRRDAITVTADMDSVTTAGNYSLPIKISIPNSDKLKITDQSIYSVSMSFDKKKTKAVPVEIVTEGNLKSDYMLGTVTASPSTINLTGPASLLDDIESVPVRINITTLTYSQSLKLDVVIYDKNGDEITNAALAKDFDTVAVNLPIYKVKEVPVTVALINSSGGSDEAIIETEISPATVRVAASESELQEYNQLILGTLDTAQYDSDSVVKFDIVTPSGITILDDISKVSVELKYLPYHTATFNIPSSSIEYRNVPSGMTPSASGSIAVKLRGVPADIDSLSASNIKANVDMSSVTATNGSVNLPVTFTVNEAENIGVIGKYTITVNLNK